jgi:protein TonB
MQPTESRQAPEFQEPVEVEPREPAETETVIEPEPMPDEPEPMPDEPEPIDFEARGIEVPSPTPLPIPRTVARISPLRRPQATQAPAQVPVPPPVASAAVAPRVTAAVPVGDRCRPPCYPAEAQRRGHEGRVVLRVHVGADGRALSVEVEESSGHAALDEAAVAAVRGWIFEPAREGDRAVESVVRVPFRFRLRA